ncbi:MAG: hypothetical protein ACRDX8_05415 [Acidimicrobiales bacterium]
MVAVMAAVRPSPGSMLKEARLRRGWSQARLVQELRRAARLVGEQLPATCTMVSEVSRWERDKGGIGPLHLRLLEVVYQTSAAEWSLGPEPADIRPGASNGLVTAAATLSVDHLATLARPADLFLDVHPTGVGGPVVEQMELLRAVAGRVDAGVVRTLRGMTEAGRQLDRTFGAGATAYYFASLWHWLQGLVPHCATEHTRRELACLSAEVGSLLGWQSVSLTRFDLALRHYGAATALAREADDAALHAFVLGESAYVELHAGRPRQALRVMRSAHCIAPLGKQPGELRVWLESALAEHLAATGHVDDSLRALDRARGHMAHSASSGTLAPIAYLDDAHLERWAGCCLARTGHPEAAGLVKAALDRSDPSFVRARSGLLLDLVTALVADGEHEEASQVLSEASALATQTSSLLQLARAARLRDQLDTDSGAPTR